MALLSKFEHDLNPKIEKILDNQMIKKEFDKHR